MHQFISNDSQAFAVMLVSYPTPLIQASIKKICLMSTSARTIEGWRSGRNLPRVEVLPGIAHATELPIGEVRLAFARSSLARKAVAKEARRKRARAAAMIEPARKQLKRAS